MKNKTAKKVESKAKEYGYSEKHAENIGRSRAASKKSREPVAKDTNKTRRVMKTPMKRGE